MLTRNGTEIPFRLDIKGSGDNVQGVFYDGFKPYDGTTSASFQDGKLTLNIDHYLTTINATLKDGQLDGSRGARTAKPSASYSFHAVRHVDTAANAARPMIAGTYVMPLDTPSSKGEKAFRLIVQQQGAEVAASILRIDGDTGSYSGKLQGRQMGAEPLRRRPSRRHHRDPRPDGTLEGGAAGRRARRRRKAPIPARQKSRPPMPMAATPRPMAAMPRC